MTLKQTIVDELLNSVEDSEHLEEVVRKFSKSKGPFYAALGEATSQLLSRLRKVREEIAAAEERQASLDQEVESLVGQILAIEQRTKPLLGRRHPHGWRVRHERGQQEASDRNDPASHHEQIHSMSGV